MLVFPFNLKVYRQKMGQYDIEQCKIAFQAKDYRAARIYAHTGIRRSPNHLEGRLYLAVLNQIYSDPNQARAVLHEGIPYILKMRPHYTQEAMRYMVELSEFFIKKHYDQELIDIIDQFMASSPGINPMNQLLAQYAASLAYLRGDFKTIDELMAQYQFDQLPEGCLIAAKLEWERGQKNKAIQRLEQGIRQFPNKGTLYVSLITHLREMGHLDDALRIVRLYNLYNPLDPMPYIMSMYCLDDQGKEGQLNQEIDAFFQQFGDRAEPLNKLAFFAAETGRLSLNESVYRHLLNTNLPKAEAFFLMLENCIRHGSFEAAAAHLEELILIRPGWLLEEEKEQFLNGFRAVVHYAMDEKELGKHYLTQYLQQSWVKPEETVALAKHFQSLEQPELAKKLFSHVYKLFPHNEAVLNGLTQTQIDTGNISKALTLLPELLESRRPPMPLLKKAYQQLGRDRFLFTLNRKQLLQQLFIRLQRNL